MDGILDSCTVKVPVLMSRSSSACDVKQVPVSSVMSECACGSGLFMTHSKSSLCLASLAYSSVISVRLTLSKGDCKIKTNLPLW